MKRANFFLSQRDAVMKVNGSVSQRPDNGSGSLRFTYISWHPFFLSVTQLLRVPDSLQQLLKDLCVTFNKSILAICTAEGGRVLDVDLIRYGRAFCSFACSWCTYVLAPSLCRAFTCMDVYIYRNDDVLWVVEAKGAESESEAAGLRTSEHGHSSPRPMSVDATHMTADFCLKPCSTGPIVEGGQLVCLVWAKECTHTHIHVCIHLFSMRALCAYIDVSSSTPCEC